MKENPWKIIRKKICERIFERKSAKEYLKEIFEKKSAKEYSRENLERIFGRKSTNNIWAKNLLWEKKDKGFITFKKTLGNRDGIL